MPLPIPWVIGSMIILILALVVPLSLRLLPSTEKSEAPEATPKDNLPELVIPVDLIGFWRGSSETVGDYKPCKYSWLLELKRSGDFTLKLSESKTLNDNVEIVGLWSCDSNNFILYARNTGTQLFSSSSFSADLVNIGYHAELTNLSEGKIDLYFRCMDVYGNDYRVLLNRLDS